MHFLAFFLAHVKKKYYLCTLKTYKNMILTNEILSVEVASHGAEPVSLKKNGREYLWNGDARFWNRHAPILFPAVGKPCNNQVHIDGKPYTLKQHGFARDCEFEQISEGRMRMMDSDHSENYPYRYNLEVQYRLNANTLEVIWRVENHDTCDMFFQIGAHPGFMLPDYNPADPVHGFLRYFNSKGEPVSPVIVSYLEEGNRVPLATPRVIPAEMPILSDSFAGDALMFEDGQVATAELCDKDGNHVLSVTCPQAQAYGIWAPNKENCPFVCLEPWCGLCDKKGFDGDISQRPYCHRLAPQEHYEFIYKIVL